MPGELIIVLIVVGAVLALALYGFCALVAKIFGAGRRRHKDRRQCVLCGNMTPITRDRCDWCGRDLTGPLATELADLDALQRQLKRFRDSRSLKPEVVDNLLRRVQGYRRRLLESPFGPPAGAPDAPVAASPPAAAREEPIVAEAVKEPPGIWPSEPAAAPAKPQAAQPKSTPQAARPKPKPRLEPVEPLPRRAPQPPAIPRPQPQPSPPREPEPQPVAASEPPRPPIAPPPPRRSWTEMLAGFMEERNIRWGELIGGLLIVGPAIALVISFWETLERNPYLQFFTFVAICSAVFGVGLYAHHRWKLESTSRGLLIIATLLVPLNFLAMAAVWKDNWGAGTLIADLVSLGIFALLVGLAGRVLAPGGRWLQSLAVVGSSAGVLLAARWVDAESADWWFLTAGCLPVLCFAAAVGGYLLRLKEHKQLDESRAAAVLVLLGTAAFALVMALGLLVTRFGDLAGALDRTSVLLALAALPILAGGLTLIRGTARDASLAAYHVTGTTIALVGMLAMLVALCFAWPHPLGIITVGTLNCAALAFTAFYYRLPILHAGAIACATLIYLTGFHVVYPHSDLPLLSGGVNLGPKMLQLTFGASSGTALGGLFVLFGLVAELLARRGRHRHGAIYAGGCAVVAVVGLLLVTWHGLAGTNPHDALRATILYAVYGAGGLALVARWRRVELSYLGLGLLALAPLWLLWWKTGQFGQLWAMVLGAEALLMGVVAAILHGRSRHEPDSRWRLTASALNPGNLIELFRIPLLNVAEVVAPAAMVLAVWTELPFASPARNCPWPVLTAVCITAFYLLAAWGYRSSQRTWVGSMVFLVGLAHTLRFNYTELVEQPWLSLLVALLAHSTLALLASVLLDVWPKGGPDQQPGETVGRVFGKPLGDTALFSSVLTLPVLPLEFWTGGMSIWSLALCLAWLAAIWLVVSWRNRDRGLFAAHQAMLTLAALVATTAWLKGHGWITDLPDDLLRPGNLQAFGIVLGLLSLAWIVVRIVLRGHPVAQKLLDPHGPSVDRIVRHAVVCGQWLLAASLLSPGFAEELLPQPPAASVVGVQQVTTGVPQAASDSGAWGVLGVMAVVLVVTLWYRWRISMVGSLLLAATIPWLIAGGFAGQQAVASALRWGWAVCFLVASAAVWQRKGLLQVCGRARAKVDVGPEGPVAARATLLITTALPVLAVTLMAALLRFAGHSPAPTPAESFFGRIGPNVSYVVPLVLVVLGLVGHAVRERSAGYAFSAGLVVEMIVTLGYVLSVTTGAGARRFEVDEFVTVVQLMTITAAAWAAAWLAIRHWLNIWREQSVAGTQETFSGRRHVGPTNFGPTPRLLMNVQLGMGAAGNVLLLVPALLSLALFHPYSQEWVIAAGKPLGWVALVSVAGASIYRWMQLGRRLPPQMVGLLGMAVLGLLACTVQWVCTGWWQLPDSYWGYRTLMLGWAAYALFIVSVTWWVATVRTLPDAQGPPQALIRAAAVWVRVAGILAVLLGLKAAIFHGPPEERLWAAAAIAVASAAGATMAVWRRREGWAFAAALGVNLAASLVVWYFHRQFLSLDEWWLRLVQANVIASAAVALAWLAVRRRLYQLRELTLGESPLLAVQTALPVVGNFALLIVPVVLLLSRPAYLPQEMAQWAQVPGWLGLLLAAAAAAWYLHQVLPGNLPHVLGGLGLGTGVLLACHAAEVNHRLLLHNWLAFHTLGTAWAAVGLVVLGIGMLLRNLRLPTSHEPQDNPPASAGRLVFPASLVQAWVTAIGVLVLALAVIYSAEDHAGVWWNLRAILSVSVAAGILALWLRQPAYVYISGLLLNVMGVIAWMAWGPSTSTNLVSVNIFCLANVLCLAVGSAAWSLLRFAHPAGVPHVQFDGRPLPFAHLAARLAVGLLVAVVAFSLARDGFGWGEVRVGRLDWLALAASTLAVSICLWDRSSRFPLMGFYFLGLAAAGMVHCVRDFTPQVSLWTAASELPGFVIIAAAVGWVLQRTKPLWRALRIPDQRDPSSPTRWSVRWFWQTQTAFAAIGAGLAAWVAIDFDFDGVGRDIALFRLHGRLEGVAGALILLGAAILMAWQTRGSWRRGWQYASMGTGVLLTSSAGWALLDSSAGTPTGDVPWLHRSAGLMVAAGMMTLLSRFGLGLVLPTRSDWLSAGRRISPMFGGLALAVLAIVLVQEVLWFVPGEGTPMAWQDIAIVAVVLAGLAAACIALAVVPEWDPLHLSESRRQMYVYAAEVLAALVGLHLWLTMPWLFDLGLVRRYWMLIVMAVAFVGAGLSEWFHRRKMPVLSKPLERTALLLPAAPAVGFWIWLFGFTDGATPTLGLVGPTPVLWFVIGLFYGYMAVSKRSIGLAALAIVTGNMGLWVLWQAKDWHFTEHPQLWLIPVALAVLVAEHLDRGRLSDQQRTSLRYAALSVIYVSSTTEFIWNIGQSVYLPLATILLSVAGVLAGILLRVRSFLLMGTAFLTVVILRMIFYAAWEQHQMWVLWSCCIALGAAIITLFAVFEKRRNDVLAAIERFKDWRQ